MTRKIKYTFAVTTAAMLLGGLVLSIRGRQSDTDEKQERSASPKKQKTEGVRLDRETQERIGLQVEPLKSAMIRPEITVYGTLEADPSEEFILRSPFTGTLVSNGQWPTVGIHVEQGRDVGSVQPLFAPMDRIALNERLASARAEWEAAKASEASATKEVDRLKRLNAEDQNASDKAVQQAEAQLAGEEAKLISARASVELITATLQERSNAGAEGLQVHKSGQVTEVSAQPGESVEAGQALLRVNRFDHLLARLYVPPGQTIAFSVARALIYPADQEEMAIPAHRVALAGAVDPRFQGQTWLFRLAAGKIALRPGEAVTARIAIPGTAERGVLIPAAAILRFQGETWVYVEKEPSRFVRRMAALDQPENGGWIVKSGFEPNEQVVVSGAQTLLSEEMKSQLESDEE